MITSVQNTKHLVLHFELCFSFFPLPSRTLCFHRHSCLKVPSILADQTSSFSIAPHPSMCPTIVLCGGTRRTEVSPKMPSQIYLPPLGWLLFPQLCCPMVWANVSTAKYPPTPGHEGSNLKWLTPCGNFMTFNIILEKWMLPKSLENGQMRAKL